MICTWRRRWHPTPVLLPGKPHGRRSLVGCSPWDLEESDTTERLHFHFSLSCIGEGNGNPLQCSCLENPRDSGAWWAAVYEVTQSRTRLKRLSSSSSSSDYIIKYRGLVTQLCPTFCKPMNCSPQGSSVHGILQARILEWITIPFSRGSSQPRDHTRVSCIADSLLPEPPVFINSTNKQNWAPQLGVRYWPKFYRYNIKQEGV